MRKARALKGTMTEIVRQMMNLTTRYGKTAKVSDVINHEMSAMGVGK
jgi:hypothetical protein